MTFLKMPLFLTVLTALALPIPAHAIYPKISVGGDYMLLLKTDGTVSAWGYNSGNGSLGTGNRDTSKFPVQVVGLTGVIDIVATSASFSMALKADGTVWVWGNISNGLSGAVTSGGIFSSAPQQLSSLHSIVSIASNGSTAFATDKKGQVWSWGSSYYGMLGDGQQTSSKTNQRGVPELIQNLTNVVKVSALPAQVIALQSDGSAVGWGQYYKNGDNLLLGLPADAYALPSLMHVPPLTFLEAVGSNTSGLFMGIDSSVSVLTWGDTNSGLLTCNQNIGNSSLSSLTQPYYPTNLNNIQQIAGGSGFALFLNQSGAVSGCGNNSYGQLGDGSTINTTAQVENTTPARNGPVLVTGLPQDISYIAAGPYASAAISSTGDVFTWGHADYGLSGLANQINAKNTIPVKVTSAGARAAAPATFAGTQFGPINAANLDVGFSVAPEHIGKQGEIYFAIILPNGQLQFLDSSNNWVAYDSTKPIPALLNEPLRSNYPIPVGENLNLFGFENTVVILGYGLGTGSIANTDLLQNNRYSPVLTLH